MEDFIERVKGLTVSDLGKSSIDELEREIRGDDDGDMMKRSLLEMRLRALESEAKLNGTYLEDCDGLWKFTPRTIPEGKEEQLRLFDNISRNTLRKYYKDVGETFELDPNNLPDAEMKSLGSASFSVRGKRDIFNNPFILLRAHLIPDSQVCAPKKPQNFITFSGPKEVYDVDPSVMIMPIMSLDSVREDWQDDISFDALVIANEEEVYEILLALHEYEMRRRQTNLPDEVNCSVIGEMPHNRSGADVVAPPQEGEDDWETLGD
ncbi:hypothetical protein SEMRO_3642_G349920.1 [Seminavis robusta]|uniref:Uncharacterized protein n=1 Tax=Seminavis robusta TaxID=568900 RepID=A0A9N8F277_9STRA|nr:hypothetical protein SEMRO_3642_G349920.1 [Seminavis robusta]|eukprot:Sro3642_g349920.1 n/a (264) ;mRNA; f:951-2013